VKERPSISITVPGGGTFELDGLPDGAFTLVFTQNGVVLGEVPVTGASGDVTVTITVQVSGSTIIVVELKIDGREQRGQPSPSACVIDGGKPNEGIELEGNVGTVTGSTVSGPLAFTMDVNGNRSSALVDVEATGASFACVGNAKSSACKSQLVAKAKVHVSGTLKTCGPASATVVASEVKIQK